jgi:DNA helicase HerA-like ATPase
MKAKPKSKPNTDSSAAPPPHHPAQSGGTGTTRRRTVLRRTLLRRTGPGRIDENGRGVISIVRLTDIQDRPKLFSTFMLQMLAEIYASFPEEGDVEQPETLYFHRRGPPGFSGGHPALMQQLEAIIKLIRSKGVGIFFITQNPVDIPDSILAQLGLKLQHSLRAFHRQRPQGHQTGRRKLPDHQFYEPKTC